MFGFIGLFFENFDLHGVGLVWNTQIFWNSWVVFRIF